MRPNGSTARNQFAIACSSRRINTSARGKGGGRKKGRKSGRDSTSIHWMPDFETRQDLNLEQWNTPYVDSRTFSRDGDESLIQAFMMDRNEPEVLQPQADEVDSFCGKAGLSDCPENHLVMMLDDRSCEPGNEGARAGLGPLTPPMALEALRKPVCLPERAFHQCLRKMTEHDGGLWRLIMTHLAPPSPTHKAPGKPRAAEPSEPAWHPTSSACGRGLHRPHRPCGPWPRT